MQDGVLLCLDGIQDVFLQFVWRKAACNRFETTAATRERTSPSPFQIQLFICSPLSVLYIPLDILLWSVFKRYFPPFMHFFYVAGVFFNSCQFLFLLLLKRFSELEEKSFNRGSRPGLCTTVRAASVTSVVSKANFETEVSTLVFIDVV